MADRKVIVYSTPTCPWCTRAKQYLKQAGVDFEEKDVSVDVKAAKEMVELTKQMGVPVIVIDGNPVVGFDKRRIDQLLGL
ncbi:MAG: glutathione S-transferase N-terminal domain-containing protein [Firmicutes bacterium]|jgi:glutaredoxin-like YruB-family protein|nr:glutathione S-transferase N-terminal domain-containing protein [Candidatus Fermentithermobacillaceae bacterium]HON87773.1 glutaredoxin domain-containing protein [Bacillota bacterium]HOV66186.1 glutaredoxin domain-containing protein [Bacillota bacterium]HRC53908.1 glutaredoxin domain-containing protein [Bacillota bacterium]